VLVWGVIAIVAVVAAYLQQSVVLVAIPIVAGVLAQIVSGRNEKKRTGIERVRAQIELLYAPWLKVAKARLERDAEYSTRFRQHMTSELGELHRHLAAPATLAAYDDLEREGTWGGDAERKVAQAFLDDYARLVAEFRRLTGEAS